MSTIQILLKLTRQTLNALVCQAFEFYITVGRQYLPGFLLDTGQSEDTLSKREHPPSPPLALCVENITTAWLTRILREKGWLDKGTEIQCFSRERFGEIGTMSTLHRLNVVTSQEMKQLSLIAKANDKTLKGRIASSLTFANEIEVGFYRDIATTDDVENLLPHPCAAFGGLDILTENSLLIMEEVSHVQKRELGDDLTLNQAKRYLSQLARMHAHYWNNPRLLELEWLKNNTRRREETWGDMMKMVWNSKGKKQVSGSMTSKQVDTLEALVNSSDAFCHQMDNHHSHTLCHGDTNPFNVLLTKADSQDGGYSFVTVDWQTVVRGNWSQDVAYFLTTNVSPDVREEHENQLLEHYRLELTKRGVSIGFEELLADFTIGNIFTLVYFVIGSGVLNMSNPTDEAMFLFFQSRVSYIMDKYDLDKVISGL